MFQSELPAPSVALVTGEPAAAKPPSAASVAQAKAQQSELTHVSPAHVMSSPPNV